MRSPPPRAARSRCECGEGQGVGDLCFCLTEPPSLTPPHKGNMPSFRLAYKHTLSPILLQPAVAPDQRVRRAVVRELGLGCALELRDNALRKHFAELDAPLIERVDLPD